MAIRRLTRQLAKIKDARTGPIKPPSVIRTVGTVTAESLIAAKRRLTTAMINLAEKKDALVAKIENGEAI